MEMHSLWKKVEIPSVFPPGRDKQFDNLLITVDYFSIVPVDGRLNLYFPLPWPDTGSTTPRSAVAFNSSDAPDGLMPMTRTTSDPPKTVWPGNASRSLRTQSAALE